MYLEGIIMIMMIKRIIIIEWWIIIK